MIIVLVDFIILVIYGEFLKVILVIILGELYILYFNFEIFILNGLQK